MRVLPTKLAKTSGARIQKTRNCLKNRHVTWYTRQYTHNPDPFCTVVLHGMSPAFATSSIEEHINALSAPPAMPNNYPPHLSTCTHKSSDKLKVTFFLFELAPSGVPVCVLHRATADPTAMWRQADL